jgi:hypothetical protein
MQRKNQFKLVAISAALLTILTGRVAAQSYGHVLAQYLSYEATWEQFTTRADAEAGTNGIASGQISTRDLQLQFDRDNPNSPAADRFLFTPGWNLSASDGTPNPSNTNLGFIQAFDLDGSTMTDSSFGFAGANNNTFHLAVSGSNALRGSSESYARAGVGPNGANSTGGDWLAYNFDITFGGLNSTTTDQTTSSTTLAPAVIGTGFILFENTQTELSPNSSLGFYRIDLTIGNDSWALDNGADLVSEFEVGPIPEPGNLGLFILLAALFMAPFSRRRSA